MANEYLVRTPTSTGNRKVWTLALWLKRNIVAGDTGADAIFNAANTASNSHGTDIRFRKDNTGNTGWNFYDYNSGAFTWGHYGSAERRDSGNWFHAMFVFDSTESTSSDRVRVYINGVLDNNYASSPGTDPSQDYESYVNSVTEHYLGVDQYDGSITTSYSKSQFADVFLVDGQALTPEVFGFYKDGNGYISAGSTQATDFRNGQWVPRTPREIKNLINDNGGFGVNGFYLPMNDSSNFGADFHTTPNSIITLKGENLPQPRNGAPDTTDAYVSQLRSDPYASNLVLAVPGISTATGANLITNGTFDNNTLGWTSEASATLSSDNGRLKVLTTNTSYGSALQVVTGLTIGQRYTFQVDMIYGDASFVSVIATTAYGGSVNQLSGWQSADYVWRTSFVADATSLLIDFQMASQSGVYGFWDNVILKAEDAPRDYSADIKGSGSNKTLTPNGNAGVGYEIPSYYGSAMSLDGSGDYFDAGSSSDFDFGSGDFTVEYWQNANSFSSTPGLGIWDDQNNQRSWLIYQNGSALPRFYVSTDGTSAGSVSVNAAAPTITTNQWNHLCMERNGSNLVGYVNGVCVGVNTTLGTQSLFTPTDPFWIGKWSTSYYINGEIQDLRVYKGVAKYKGVGFDVPKPYTPVGIATWRVVSDTCQNNFATLNPLHIGDNTGNNTYTNGNLKAQAGSNNQITSGNMGVSSGKWYWETRLYRDEMVGIFEADGQEPAQYPGQNAYGVSYHFGGGVYQNGSTNYGSGWAANTYQIIGCALDVDNKRLYWHVNGVWANEADPETENGYWDYSKDDSGVSYVDTATHVVPGWRSRSATAAEQVSVNFGQNPTFGGEIALGVTYPDSNGIGQFKYQPPSGYLAICSKNLPEPGIKNPGEHVKTLLWEGDGVKGRAITGLGFKPDLIWTYERTSNSAPYIIDSTIGNEYWIATHAAQAQGASGNWLQSFDDDGFTMGTDGAFNQDGQTHIGWCWKAGGQQTTTNSDGSIMSEVSVNDDAGFSIVSWESVASNTATRTVGHGLSSKPDFILLKNRDASTNWRVYHHKLGTNGLALNTTEAAFSFWPSEPTDSVITLANSTTTGEATNYGNDTISAYCWREVEGYSKFGRFVGNEDADGPFVYLGFKPALVMIKCDSTISNWGVFDSSRHSTNPHSTDVYWNLSDTEYTSNVGPDFLSNGFKMRTTNTTWNGDGKTYVYAAWAETPFKYANAK